MTRIESIRARLKGWKIKEIPIDFVGLTWSPVTPDEIESLLRVVQAAEWALHLLDDERYPHRQDGGSGEPGAVDCGCEECEAASGPVEAKKSLARAMAPLLVEN